MVQSFNAPDGIDPWLAGRIDPSAVTLMDTADGVPFETVASVVPDLILTGTHFPIDEDHATLTGIAPVVTTRSGRAGRSRSPSCPGRSGSGRATRSGRGSWSRWASRSPRP